MLEFTFSNARIVVKKYVWNISFNLINEFTNIIGILKKGNGKNEMIRHNLETNHSFNFKDSKMLVNIHNKKHWKIVEFSIFR